MNDEKELARGESSANSKVVFDVEYISPDTYYPAQNVALTNGGGRKKREKKSARTELAVSGRTTRRRNAAGASKHADPKSLPRQSLSSDFYQYTTEQGYTSSQVEYVERRQNASDESTIAAKASPVAASANDSGKRAASTKESVDDSSYLGNNDTGTESFGKVRGDVDSKPSGRTRSSRRSKTSAADQLSGKDATTEGTADGIFAIAKDETATGTSGKAGGDVDSTPASKPSVRRSSRRSIPTDFYHNGTAKSPSDSQTARTNDNRKYVSDSLKNAAAPVVGEEGRKGKDATQEMAPKPSDDSSSVEPSRRRSPRRTQSNKGSTSEKQPGRHSSAANTFMNENHEAQKTLSQKRRPSEMPDNCQVVNTPWNDAIAGENSVDAEVASTNTAPRRSSRKSIPTDFYHNTAGKGASVDPTPNANQSLPTPVTDEEIHAVQESALGRDSTTPSQGSDSSAHGSENAEAALEACMNVVNDEPANATSAGPPARRVSSRKSVPTDFYVAGLDDLIKKSLKSSNEKKASKVAEKPSSSANKGSRPEKAKPQSGKESVAVASETELSPTAANSAETDIAEVRKKKSKTKKRGRPRKLQPESTNETDDADKTSTEKEFPPAAAACSDTSRSDAGENSNDKPVKVKAASSRSRNAETPATEQESPSPASLLASSPCSADTPPSKRKKRRLRVIPSSLRPKKLSSTMSCLVTGSPSVSIVKKSNSENAPRRVSIGPGRPSKKRAMNYNDGKIASILGADVSDISHTTKRSRVASPKSTAKASVKRKLMSGDSKSRNETNTEEKKESSIEPKKRKRGRPRKHPQPPVEDVNPATEQDLTIESAVAKRSEESVEKDIDDGNDAFVTGNDSDIGSVEIHAQSSCSVDRTSKVTGKDPSLASIPAPVPKKKRGRPRKHPLPSPSAPKKRGRPRKHPIPPPVAVTDKPDAPKKRGRPRKHPLPPTASVTDKPDAPKKRGRPRKHPLPPTEPVTERPDAGVANTVPPKRKRGRPRKHPLPDEPDAGVVNAVPQKRKRGRPRKHPLLDESGAKQRKGASSTKPEPKRRGRPRTLPLSWVVGSDDSDESDEEYEHFTSRAAPNDDDSDDSEVKLFEAPKRRGRPPKQVDPAVGKRPRGRPRKKGRRVTKDCGTCLVCLKGVNCGRCEPCLNMVEFGGDGSLGTKCLLRLCITPIIMDERTDGIAAPGDANDSGDNMPAPVGRGAAGLSNGVSNDRVAMLQQWCDSGVESLSDNDSMAVDDMSDMEWEVGYERNANKIKGVVSLTSAKTTGLHDHGSAQDNIGVGAGKADDPLQGYTLSAAQVQPFSAPKIQKDAAVFARELLRQERLQYFREEEDDDDDDDDGSDGFDNDLMVPPPPPLDFGDLS